MYYIIIVVLLRACSAPQVQVVVATSTGMEYWTMELPVLRSYRLPLCHAQTALR